MLYMKDRENQGKGIKGVGIHVACLDASSWRVSGHTFFRNILEVWHPKGGILMWYTCVSCRLGVPHVCYNLSCNIFDCFRLFLIIGIVTPKTLFICVLLYLWLPCYFISLFVLTSTAFLLWLLFPFPHFIALPLLFLLSYVTHPLYPCLTGTDLYPPLLLCHCYLNSYPCLTVFFAPPFHSFP